MRAALAAPVIVALAWLAAPASAHGDLALHEFDVRAISDFEGQEDSFAWEGFEIWDVYVGDGYNFLHDSDGVYFKANFAGDGTQRPTGSAAWTIDVAFNVGGEAFERSLSHDGSGVSSNFEALEWTIADGNVLQIKGWVPVANATGKAVTGIVLVSSVDGERRDIAPGGIYAPVTGAEIPVQAPATPIFPPLGEGRIVDEVPVTGPAKYLDVAVVPQGGGVFGITVKNTLSEQGQHVLLRPLEAGAWRMNATSSMVELAGGASASFQVALAPTVPSGLVQPVPVDFYSDIGGRRTYYAYLEGDEVALVDDRGAAHETLLDEGQQAAPAAGSFVLVAALAAAGWTSRARRP